MASLFLSDSAGIGGIGRSALKRNRIRNQVFRDRAKADQTL